MLDTSQQTRTGCRPARALIANLAGSNSYCILHVQRENSSEQVGDNRRLKFKWHSQNLRY